MHVRGAQYLRTHPSTADQEETPPKSAPARKKGLEVLGCAAQDERETYVTKAPKTKTTTHCLPWDTPLEG